MAIRSKGDAERMRALARRLYISNDTIDWFLSSSNAAQLRAVSELIEHEMAVREESKRARLFRRAKFPQVKSFEGYDFSQVAFPDGYGVDDLKSLSFVEAAQDFVFHGQTGRGKTRLAIAVGHACVMAGKAVRFYTAAELALALSKARRELALEAMMRDIAKNDLVILDEFGYVPLDTESARLLFQVVSSCYESRSMIFTTNIEFSKWGTVLGDDKLASAMIDRIVHHGRLVEFNGASHRMDAALMLGRAKNSEGCVCQSAQMQRAALLTFCLPQTRPGVHALNAKALVDPQQLDRREVQLLLGGSFRNCPVEVLASDEIGQADA